MVTLPRAPDFGLDQDALAPTGGGSLSRRDCAAARWRSRSSLVILRPLGRRAHCAEAVPATASSGSTTHVPKTSRLDAEIMPPSGPGLASCSRRASCAQSPPPERPPSLGFRLSLPAAAQEGPPRPRLLFAVRVWAWPLFLEARKFDAGPVAAPKALAIRSTRQSVG